MCIYIVLDPFVGSKALWFPSPTNDCHVTMSNYAKWLISNGQNLQSRNEPSQFDPATSPLGAEVIDPLPPTQRNGLIAVSTVASVSLVAICLVLFFLTHRFIFWRRYYRRYIGYNQYIVLVYNLAIADLIQGLGFIVSLRWIATNSIHASDASCFMQGIWLQAGNPMSGVFVFAISVFTFLHIVLDFQLGHRKFVGVVVGLWMFGVLMVVIPIATVGRYVWFPSVAWVSSPFIGTLFVCIAWLISFLLVLDNNSTPSIATVDTLLLDLRRSISYASAPCCYVHSPPAQNCRLRYAGRQQH